MDCTTFSTCQKTARTTRKIKACWENLNKLFYDTELKLFCKEKFGVKICYDLGECQCGELYLERDRLTTPLCCWFCDTE